MAYKKYRPSNGTEGVGFISAVEIYKKKCKDEKPK